jgi:HTH-type transcriptional regulator, glycine betaine synthesis regulator
VDPATNGLARLKAKRLEQLAELTRVALTVLRVLLDSARADVGPIKAISEALARRSD